MKEVISFLEQLERNNNREWFNAHKSEYLAAQKTFDAFIGQLIAGISSFDPSVKDVTVKESTYRIYRDTRFSQDKTPYKSHIGAFICPGGRKSGFAGYCFQVGAEEEGFAAGNVLAAGHYLFSSGSLRTLREDICNGDGDFERTLKQARPFYLDNEDRLKRVPNGFPAHSPYADLLKYRHYCLCYSPGKAFMQTDCLLERTLELLHRTQPFMEYINRAIAYTREEL